MCWSQAGELPGPKAQRMEAETTHCELCIPTIVQEMTWEPPTSMISLTVSREDKFRVFDLECRERLMRIDLRY